MANNKKPNRVLTNFKLPVETIARLKKMAGEKKRTMTSLVVEAIDEIYAVKKSS